MPPGLDGAPGADGARGPGATGAVLWPAAAALLQHRGGLPQKRIIPFKKQVTTWSGNNIDGNFKMLLDVDFGTLDTARPGLAGDTGSGGLVMWSWDVLVKAQPDIVDRVIARGVQDPWGCNSNLVNGTLRLQFKDPRTGAVQLEPLHNVPFFARLSDQTGHEHCRSDKDPLPMNMEGYDVPGKSLKVYPPFSPKSGATPALPSLAQLDYDKNEIVLSESCPVSRWLACRKGQWMDDLPGVWGSPRVYITQVDLNGVDTKWAQGKGGPVQHNAVGAGTIAAMDTGGGPIQIGNKCATCTAPGCADLPEFPAPKYPIACPAFWRGFHAPNNCKCYADQVTFHLEGNGGGKTQLTFTQDSVVNAMESSGGTGSTDHVPTMMVCDGVCISGGNYANLGGILFNNYPSAIDYKRNQMCNNAQPV